MIGQFLNFKLSKKDQDKIDQVFASLKEDFPESGEDHWGLNLQKSQKTLELLYPIYKNYFSVRVFGTENVQDEAYMAVSNHTGQIAIDGMLISIAFAMEISPPRIVRSMVERFFTQIPFLAEISAANGAVLGDRQNCLNLLKKNQTVLAFPEGVPGIAKSTSQFYQLQKFTRGFLRMAALSEKKILPIAVVGAEEFFPFVYQAKDLAKYLSLPALPLSANYFPLPSPVDIYFGKPYHLPASLSAQASDEEVDQHVFEIKKQIQSMVDLGRKKKRSLISRLIK